jgi:hypothetical protein
VHTGRIRQLERIDGVARVTLQGVEPEGVWRALPRSRALTAACFAPLWTPL